MYYLYVNGEYLGKTDTKPAIEMRREVSTLNTPAPGEPLFSDKRQEIQVIESETHVINFEGVRKGVYDAGPNFVREG